MDLSPVPPAVSRETRLLIATVVISITALWVLSRVRFPERPAAPPPVAPILAPLVRPPGYADLAADVTDLQAQVAPHMVPLRAGQYAGGGTLQGFRIATDQAIALAPGDPVDWNGVLGRDHATALTIFSAPNADVSVPATWSPRQLQYPRYLFAADAAAEGTALRPIFVDAMHALETPLWPGVLWAVRAGVDVAARTFLFTADGWLAGVVVDIDGGKAIVPGALLLREAGRLQQQGYRRPGDIGVEVRARTTALAAAIGEAAGVVVVWVDPAGAASAQLAAGDLVESVDNLPTPTVEHWTARVARLVAGETITVHGRRPSGMIDITLTARDASAIARPILGLTMRTVRGIGAEVVAVERASMAERAGLRAGDLITTAGAVHAPTAAQVTRAVAAAADGRAVLVAIDRGGAHDVTALVKR
jgi:PDZ domain